MQENYLPKIRRFKSVILLWATGLLCIVLVTTVSVLLSLPTDSVANAEKDAYTLVGSAATLSAVAIPITFLVVLLTRPKRNR